MVITLADHKKMVNVETVAIVNESLDSQKPTFEVISDPLDPVMRSFWFKVKCVVCPKEVFQLCPAKKNLEANLMNHMHGVVHAKAVEELKQRNPRGQSLHTGKRGRPTRPLASASESTQTGLHDFFKHSQGEFLHVDSTPVSLCMCWGFRGPTCVYGGKTFDVTGILSDPHPGKHWYTEPHLETLLPLQQQVLTVKGSFRHRDCKRICLSGEPFFDFTCSKCCSIPLETNFRLRVVREEHSVSKRGSRSTAGGRRVGYLSMLELNSYSRVLA